MNEVKSEPPLCDNVMIKRHVHYNTTVIVFMNINNYVNVPLGLDLISYDDTATVCMNVRVCVLEGVMPCA